MNQVNCGARDGAGLFGGVSVMINLLFDGITQKIRSI